MSESRQIFPTERRESVHAPIPAQISVAEQDLESLSKAIPIIMIAGGLVSIIPLFSREPDMRGTLINLATILLLLIPAPILIRKRVRVGPRGLMYMAFAGSVALGSGFYFDLGAANGPDAAIAQDGPFALWIVIVASYFLGLRQAIGVALFALFMMVSPALLAENRPQISGLFSLWITIVAVGAFVLRARFHINDLVGELERNARTDHLTGMPNRRMLESSVQSELQRSIRSSTPLSLLTMDIDHFKRINDQYGHQVGDEVLILVASLIRETLRDVDIPARVGGEEFSVLLPDTPMKGAMNAAERLRECIELHFLDHEVNATVSVGVASCPDNGITFESLQAASDNALYEAKSTGRNRVVGARADDSVEAYEEVADDDNQDLREITPLFDLASNIRSLVSGDELTPRISRRVAEVSGGIAMELGWSGARCERIRIAGQLHDLGKVGVPLDILVKPEELQESEWELIRQHPVIASNMLEKHKLVDIGSWIIAQHERFDGKGYPYGLRADEIPDGARILAVAQAYVAMTTNRLYRPPMTPDQARQEITSCSGSQFDPIVVGAFVRWLWSHRSEWPKAA